MVVPGLYGYVSATKWVTDLEVTRFDRATAYWTARGWSDRGPIKLESRIDVPRQGRAVPAGDAVIAGPRVPLGGFQDEADPAVAAEQIELAVRHGIDGFLVDYYWYDDGTWMPSCGGSGCCPPPSASTTPRR